MIRVGRPVVVIFVFALCTQWAEAGDLNELIISAEQNNPEIAAAEAKVNSEKESTVSEGFLGNPKLGWMRENNLTSSAGPMTYWSVSQEIKFPWKYHLLRSAQDSRAKVSEQNLRSVVFKVRADVINNYFVLNSCYQILDFLNLERETLRQAARIAESKRATGTGTQQDEMKIHTEQTRIDAEILLQVQDCENAATKLKSLLGISTSEKFVFEKKNEPTPKLKTSPNNLIDLVNGKSLTAPEILAQQHLVSVNEFKVQQAKWNYAPDFGITYKKGAEGTMHGDAIGVELSIPLWFLSRQNPELKSEQWQLIEEKKNLEKLNLYTEAEIQTMGRRLETLVKLISIYETALIPQSTATLNSSEFAYRAGKINLIELLDSARSLYATKIVYSKTLVEYVQAITSLEKIIGQSISDLPIGDKI